MFILIRLTFYKSSFVKCSCNLYTKKAIYRYVYKVKMNLSSLKHDNLYFNTMLAFTLFPKVSNSCMNLIFKQYWKGFILQAFSINTCESATKYYISRNNLHIYLLKLRQGKEPEDKSPLPRVVTFWQNYWNEIHICDNTCIFPKDKLWSQQTEAW